jgi:hypothetical protein
MAALHSTAAESEYRSFVPETRSLSASFDHLVGAAQQPWLEGMPSAPADFEVDDQLDLIHLLDLKLARVFALEFCRCEITARDGKGSELSRPPWWIVDVHDDNRDLRCSGCSGAHGLIFEGDDEIDALTDELRS